ncbi:hypothetical protein PA598K_04564 [Paenibacillus sp. 598K]|nr:hypothetical protein PA598K_04564 [Paenibacillus sp. 598K]
MYVKVVLALLLAAGPIVMLAGAGQVYAQIKRVAIVTELKGTVNVKKSGGSKTFAAFKNMTLNEGDTVTTAKGGKLVLELSSSKAAQDSITIGENSQVTFTTLKDDKGTKTKMNVWAGSLWVKVKSITNASDQFELETPTAIMGVRGTHFLVHVAPQTGITTLSSLSGIITGKHASNKTDSQVLPSQQIVLLPEEEGGPDDLVTIIDLEELVAWAGSDIVREIIRSSKDIQEENDRMIQRWTESGPPAGIGIDDLSRVSGNLNRLIDQVVKEAIKQQQLTRDEAKRLADQVNPALPDKNKIQLDEEQSLDFSDAEKDKKKRVDEVKRKAEEKKKQEKAAQDEQRKKQQQLIDRLTQAKKEQMEANKKAAEDALKKLEEAYKKTMSEQEKQRFESDKENRLAEQGQTGTGTSPPYYGSNPPAAAQPSARLVLEGSVVDSAFILGVQLNQFVDSRAIYGFQIKLAYDEERVTVHDELMSGATGLTYRTGGGVFRIHPGTTAGSGYDSADHYNRYNGGFMYALTKYSGQAASISSPTTVVRLPFQIRSGAQGPTTIRIMELIAVDASGEPIGAVQTTDLSVTLPTN